MKRSALFVATALFLGACGGAATPTETTVPSTSETTTATEAPVPAPDFTLALADGSSFTLSEEAKPVFMVFWAEW